MTLARLHAKGLSFRQPRSRPSRRIPILSFHRVSRIRPDHWMTVTPEAFENVVRSVQSRYRVVSLAEVDRLLGAGNDVEPTVAVAFDDTYGCNHLFAVPVLRKLKIPATFFVASGFVDSARPFPHDVVAGFSDLPNFTSAQLRDMADDALFEIGSHSVTHIDFATPPSTATYQHELGESKRALAALTGQPIDRFAVPFGGRPQCTPELIAAAKEAGYRRTYSGFGGSNLISDGGQVAFVLNRLCPERHSPEYVLACLGGYEGRRSFTLRRPREAPLSADFQTSGF